jgi:hypothetical protein
MATLFWTLRTVNGLFRAMKNVVWWTMWNQSLTQDTAVTSEFILTALTMKMLLVTAYRPLEKFTEARAFRRVTVQTIKSKQKMSFP